MPSRATGWSTAPWPPPSGHALGVKRSSSSAAATTTARSGPFGGVARRIKAYAGSDPELRAQLRELEEARVDFAAPMSMAALKQAHFTSTNLLRSKDALGRSRRRPQQ